MDYTNKKRPLSPSSLDPNIDPHNLMHLKVIGRGTFAQVVISQHTQTQSIYVFKTLDKAQLI